MHPDQMTDEQKRLFDNIINPVKVGPRVKGRFKLRAMKGDIIVRETPWCPNIVVNGYFDRLFNGTATYVNGFLAGAGTSMPAVTDTALQSYLGGGNSVQDSWHVINSTVSPRSVTLGYRIRGAEGAVVGNVSEVGLYAGGPSGSSPASNRPLINRARVTDELGNPTSITVLADEFLEVVWEFVFYAIDGATGTLTINIDGTPTNFDYEIRPIAMNYSSYWDVFTGGGNNYRRIGPSPWLVASTAANANISKVTDDASFIDPSASTLPPGHVIANSFTGRTAAAYVPGSLNRTFTLRLPLNNGNMNVRSIILLSGVATTTDGGSSGGAMAHQVLLDGPFEKKPTHIFDLPVNVSMGNA